MWMGVLLAPLGIAGYMVQFIGLRRLDIPWYTLALAGLGVVLVIISLWSRFTIWRLAALLFVGGLAVLELLAGYTMRLPEYKGPAVPGQAFPAFTAARDDGKPFTQDSLKGDKDTAMVFFRGHW
jgi:hypothetical protein